MKRPPKAPSITVSDVAREAKVSKATAARVLGGYGTVSETVRAAVLEALSAPLVVGWRLTILIRIFLAFVAIAS